MKRYDGHCSCGRIQFTVRLPRPIEQYRLRQCDCNYCSQKQLKYLSDPQGAISVCDQSQFDIEHQGSGQASFYLCPTCNDMILCAGNFPSGTKGAVNACLIETVQENHQTETVSPAQLSAVAKRKRWENVWSPINFLNATSA